MEKKEKDTSQDDSLDSLVGKEKELEEIADILIDLGYTEESLSKFYEENPIEVYPPEAVQRNNQQASNPPPQQRPPLPPQQPPPPPPQEPQPSSSRKDKPLKRKREEPDESGSIRKFSIPAK